MRASLVLTFAVLLLAPAAASAQLPLEVDGVRVVEGEKALRVVFGPKAKDDYRKIAGRKVVVDCDRVSPTDGPVLNRDAEGIATTTLLIAPRKRRALKVGKGDFDLCRLQARRTVKRQGGTRETRIVLDLTLPVTQRGAVFIDEAETAAALELLLNFVTPAGGEGSYRPAQQAVDRSAVPAVVLDSPDATPPGDRLGLYSDGAQHATAVAVTKSGRRVFIDVNGDALSTNLSSVLLAR